MQQTKPAAPNGRVPEHVERSVGTIADLHQSTERNVSKQQRRMERATALLGRPSTTYIIISLVAFWAILNSALRSNAPDPPPYAGLQTAMSLCALLMTTIILTAENRRTRQAERRAELSLQMTTLTEAKVAKLIELVERLRVDLPEVVNRVDRKAQEMTAATDPKQVLEVMDAREANPATG